MNDLTEIALNALESDKYAETDDNATNTTDDGADEQDTSNTGDGDETNNADETGKTENENTDDNAGDDSGDETDADDKSDANDSDEKDESESDDKKETKKKSDEMTDDEFEELAKKRGYSKKSDDDERKKVEDAARQRADAINAIPKPKELDADTWSAMPPMNRLIYSRLPYVTVHGKDGDVKIKTPEQLPDDFEFASDKARAQYTNDIQAQETMAQQMANAIQTRAREQQMSTQRQAQARRIIDEVSELQRSGDLPKPTSQPNTPEFDNDPAVKVINKVLNYQITRARQGVNLSVRDAYLLYRSEHPDDFKKPENETKAKGDEERKNVAKKVSGNTKSTNQTAADESAGSKRKYYRPGMSTQDVLERALNDLD